MSPEDFYCPCFAMTTYLHENKPACVSYGCLLQRLLLELSILNSLVRFLALQFFGRCREFIWAPSLLDDASHTQSQALSFQLLFHMLTVSGNVLSDTQAVCFVKVLGISQSGQAENMDEPS